MARNTQNRHLEDEEDRRWRSKGGAHQARKFEPDVCPDCNGLGVIDGDICPRCEGEGEIWEP